MTGSPDVTIIGAGVIGASCAVHFARSGFRVTLLDRGDGPGAGSTFHATGGFRAQYGSAINIQLSLLSRQHLLAFADDTGVDPGFVAVGYLWLADAAEQMLELRTANSLQQREGLRDARIVDPDDIRALNPHASIAGIVGGAWCPSDGVMRPREILRGYLELATQLGVDVRWGETVVALERTTDRPIRRAAAAGRDRITRVVTSKSAYATGLVVIAAGAWSSRVGELAGIAIPVSPLRRQVAITIPTTAVPSTMPLTIWLADGFHARVRDDRVLLLRPTPGDPADPWSLAVDDTWHAEIATLAATRFPALAKVSLDRDGAWAGLYEMTPDHHALLGFAPGVDNVVLATGASGHGVMHAPALGVLAAELALHGETRTLDAHALRPSRFLEGDPVRGGALL